MTFSSENSQSRRNVGKVAKFRGKILDSGIGAHRAGIMHKPHFYYSKIGTFFRHNEKFVQPIHENEVYKQVSQGNMTKGKVFENFWGGDFE